LVVPGGNSAPIIEASEHGLDLVAAFVAALVVFDGLSTGLQAWDARLYPFGFQRISEPVGIVTPIWQQPLGLGQTPLQSRRSGVVTDLTCGHEKAGRAAIAIGDGMKLGIFASFGSANQTSKLVVWLP
jgi:hypothetical protein